MDLAFRYNDSNDDIDIVNVDNDTVVDNVGSDVFVSWVNAYNKKHGYVQRVEIEQENKEEEKPVEEEKTTEETSEETVDEAKED
jgi:hypothetical protein